LLAFFRFCRVRCSAEYSGVRLRPECITANAVKQISWVRGWSLGLLMTGRWPAAKCWGQSVAASAAPLVSAIPNKTARRRANKSSKTTFKIRKNASAGALTN